MSLFMSRGALGVGGGVDTGDEIGVKVLKVESLEGNGGEVDESDGASDSICGSCTLPLGLRRRRDIRCDGVIDEGDVP
jgi:hypothetical protein